MGLFTTRQIKAVREYEYVSESLSISDPYLYVIWGKLFKLVPRTWAANTLTTIGILINVATTFLIISYNPDGLRQVPSWVHYVRAAGIFTYLALDALDGMQGRRTRDGALEELFDHGFDSISTVCVGIGGCFTLQLTRDPVLLLAMMCLAEFVFYTSTWQHYVTGIMRFWRFDASEANLAIIFIHILCAVSPDIFDENVPLLDIQLRNLCVIGNVLLSLFLFSRHIYCMSVYITRGPNKRNSPKLQNSGSNVFPVIPIAMAIGLKVLVAMTTSIYTDQPCWYLISFGIVMSKLTITMIMAHITKGSVPYFDWILIGPVILLINQHFGIIPEGSLLWAVCIYSVVNWIVYFREQSIEICRHLNIYCFNVTSHPRRAAS